MSAKKNGVKPSKKNKGKENIPFPVAYFGFIFAFILSHYQQLWESIPSWEKQKASTIIPEFETAKLPLFSFFVVCPLLYLWRNLAKTLFFEPLAEKWAGLTPNTFKFDKFCEQAWLAMHYFIATSVGYFVLREKPWWPPAISRAAQLEISASDEDRYNDQQSHSLAGLYALQLGFYTLELVTLMLAKGGRSDAVMYFFHHIYTMYLMAGSWVSYNHRIGVLVLFLHDIGDIFLPIGKCYTYAEEHIRTTKSKAMYELHKVTGMAFFVLFVIGFAIPRLILYGMLVHQGMFQNAWHSCCGINFETGYCGPCKMGPLWPTTLTATLGLLYPMHVYWFYLIVKMAYRLIFAPGDYDDVRSDEEKED